MSDGQKPRNSYWKTFSWRDDAQSELQEVSKRSTIIRTHTGGTILDWHTGFSSALAKAGAKYGLQKDWPGLANELRRRSLGLTVKMGGTRRSRT